MSSVFLSEAGICHGTAISCADQGLLILGTSGQGKSRLALELLAYGAALISDDAVRCERVAGDIILSSPEPSIGLIEARHIGLLRAPTVKSRKLALVVDLDQPEPQRLPPFREIECLGLRFPLIHGKELSHLAPAILLYLRHGRDQ